MTPDTRSLGPPSLHDNTVGAQEKMQCTELEASIQAMRWEAETWLQGGEKDNTGPPEWRTDTEGLPEEQLRPSVTTLGPLALRCPASMDGLLDRSQFQLPRQLLAKQAHKTARHPTFQYSHT